MFGIFLWLKKKKKKKKLRPKNYDHCIEIKKEATATQTLFYLSETFFFLFSFFDNLPTTTRGKIQI